MKYLYIAMVLVRYYFIYIYIYTYIEFVPIQPCRDPTPSLLPGDSGANAVPGNQGPFIEHEVHQKHFFGTPLKKSKQN